MKTIAKFFVFVIFLCAASFVHLSCSKVISNEPASIDPSTRPLYQKPAIRGYIESGDVIESSGISASKCLPGVFWTHNDSGDDPNIYALNERGENLGTFRVSNARNEDWEDIAEYKDLFGKCFIYIADIGDNKLRKPGQTIYRVAEPVVGETTRNTNSQNPVRTEPATALNFRYSDGEHNAESMMVNPQSGDIYVLTKSFEHPSEVFKLAGSFGSAEIITAQKIGEIAVPNVPNGQLTGGDISSDGKHVVLCDYSWAYELELPVNSMNFDEIWRVKPDRIDIGKLPQGEAVGYTADGSGIVATSEKKHSPIIEVKRNQ